MKKLIIISTLLLLPLSAFTQTAADYDEARAAHNRDACAVGKLPANCSDEELGAVLLGVRGIDQTVYSTNTAYRDAVIVAPRLKERLEQRKNRLVERLLQLVVEQPAKCLAVMTAAELPTDVCK